MVSSGGAQSKRHLIISSFILLRHRFSSSGLQ
jgi:hypothetical protein